MQTMRYTENRERRGKPAGIRAACLLLCATLLLGLSGCQTGPGTSSAGGGQTESTTPTTQPPEEAKNPLTGLYDMPIGGSSRPIGIMIGNNEKSRPQIGIDQADLFIEGETEGGITRILAVFSCIDHVPDTVGPVRSARSPFVTLAQALDLVYCHAGGSAPALETLKRIDIATVNGLVYDGTTYWRDPQLREEKGYEYSLMTGQDKLEERVTALDYRTYSRAPAPFAFGEKAGTGAGNRVQIDVSGAQTIHFLYDGAGTYTKYNGGFDTGEKHVTADGTPLTVANVAVIYADKFMENDLTCDFDLSAGHGILVSGGASRDIRYTCSASGLQLTETDGSPLQMATGKTYLCFVNTRLEENTVVA